MEKNGVVLCECLLKIHIVVIIFVLRENGGEGKWVYIEEDFG